jgi:hypothetical protein
MKKEIIFMSDPTLAEPTLSRATMLRRTGAIMGTLAAGSVLAALAPSRVWALDLTSLSQPDGDTILSFAQVLYPHATLPTAVYAFVVRDLDIAAAKDPQLAASLHAGCASLDAAASGSFVKASPAAQLAAVKSIEGTPFFGTVRGKCITSLYDNQLAYAHFGYQGASWPHGGYLHRGFNDLAWLPNPPPDASPTLGSL